MVQFTRFAGISVFLFVSLQKIYWRVVHPVGNGHNYNIMSFRDLELTGVKYQ